MRSHAKASTAGSTQRQAEGLGAFLRGVFATRGGSLISKGSSAPKAGRLATSASALIGSFVAMALLAVPASAATPAIAATWSVDVVYTEARLKAEINPEGKATTYHFEYGTSEAYGSETPELAVGSDSSVHTVARFLEGLQVGVTYHYRVVAANADGVSEGPDRAFATYEPFAPDTSCPNQVFRDGASANLPDCRAYEMVSPVNKNGADVHERSLGIARYQASSNGEKLTYSASAAFGDTASSLISNQYLASRSPGGWSSHGLNPPRGTTVFDPGFSLLSDLNSSFMAFSPDLCFALVRDDSLDPLTADAIPGYTNAYVRDNCAPGEDIYKAFTVGPAPLSAYEAPELGVYASNYSSDLSHVVFIAVAALSPDAALSDNTKWQIYDSSEGQLHLVSVLPGGEASPGANSVGTSSPGGPIVDQAVSEDGSRIFWTANDSTSIGSGGPGKVYVRVDNAETVPVSESVTSAESQFWTADPEGSVAVFGVVEGTLAGNLYEFDVDNETPTLIAGEVGGVVGASEDLSYLYFTSEEDLAAGATAGETNLYLRHGGTVTFIAVIDGDLGIDSGDAGRRRSRVTPDGRHLLFVSARKLTGYDNTDSTSGEADLEVYRYAADTGELTCVSCNPSGARPAGRLVGSAWVAAEINGHGTHNSLSANRSLSHDGSRVFFNAYDALIPTDTNSAADVYQWEAPGTGDCSAGTPAYSAPNEGCISLISTGKNAEDSEFLDAASDGSNVFFRTQSSIDSLDEGLFDVYDAREGGGLPLPVESPACEGDNCQSPPSPPDDATPTSAGFHGAGDPVALRSCAAPAKRAARLSRQADRLRRRAAQFEPPRGARELRRKAARLVERAHRLSRSAKRCRRAERRAGR